MRAISGVYSDRVITRGLTSILSSTVRPEFALRASSTALVRKASVGTVPDNVAQLRSASALTDKFASLNCGLELSWASILFFRSESVNRSGSRAACVVDPVSLLQLICSDRQ